MAGSDQVVRALQQFGEVRLRGAVTALAMREAADMESEAKRDAPWEDRTGNARNGLFGNVEVREKELKLGVGHSVDYGPYLELRQGPGRREILQPVRDAHVDPFYEAVQELVR